MPFSFKPPEGQAPQVDIFSKDAITTRIKESGGNIMLFFSVVVFIVTTVIAGGLFAYQLKLKGDVNSQKARLAEYDTKLGVLPIDEMRSVSNRIKYASRLIEEHASVNSAFRVLEDSVENPVTFTKFELQNNQVSGNYDLTLGGKAPDYRSVIQQQETFRNKPYTKYLLNPVFSGVGADEKGTVTFSVKSSILIRGILPESMIIQSQDDVVKPAQQTPGVPASSTKPTSP